ncbi:MAG: V-type ATPase subunit [Clostridiales bacterium]|nr:V-type ATPase subunit [Clostridiales bacterium]
MGILEEQKYAGLFSKVRALYSKRLRTEDYKRLTGMHSIAEVVSYLKRHPSWEKTLSQVDEFSAHRGYLEAVLRRSLLDEFDRMLNFIPTADKGLTRFVIEQFEIDLILSFLRYYSLGMLEDFSVDLPEPFSKRSRISLPALNSAKTYQDLLTSVRRTPYYGALTRLAPTVEQSLDYYTIELVLWQIYYDTFFSVIHKNYSGETRKLLLDFLGAQVDLENISRVLRLKMNFQVASSELIDYMIHSNYKISDDFLRSLSEAEMEEDIIAQLMRSPYRKIFANRKLNDIMVYMFDYYVSESRKLIFHSSPSIYLCIVYLNLKKAEISNLVHIIESVRYSVTPENIFFP